MSDSELNDSAELPDASSTDDVSSGVTAESAPRTSVKRKKTSIFVDPLVRKLTVAAIALVALYLVTVVSALLTGVLGSDVPRTALQNDLLVAEQNALAKPGDADAWAGYASTLIRDGQYRKAQDVIDEATKTVDQTKSQIILFTQAQLYFEMGEYETAVETCDEVRSRIKAAYEAALEDPESPESKLGDPIHTNYWEVLVLKAEALVEMGDNEGAIQMLDEYLKENPTMQAVLIRRGDLRAEEGDIAGAEADYRNALLYTKASEPEYETVMDRLKKIGAE